jgi:hypothetical protein
MKIFTFNQFINESKEAQSPADLEKQFRNHIKDFYFDRNIGGYTYNLQLDAGPEVNITLRHVDPSDYIDKTTLVIELPDGSGATLTGSANISKFFKDNNLKKMKTMLTRDLDAMLTKYNFQAY